MEWNSEVWTAREHADEAVVNQDWKAACEGGKLCGGKAVCEGSKLSLTNGASPDIEIRRIVEAALLLSRG